MHMVSCAKSFQEVTLCYFHDLPPHQNNAIQTLLLFPTGAFDPLLGPYSVIGAMIDTCTSSTGLIVRPDGELSDKSAYCAIMRT
ncbi:hypothetical protein STEG23_034095, partial [Scotinomys teguina]